MEEFEETASRRGLRIHETDKNIIAEAVVAGIPADNVDIHIEDGVVKVAISKAEAAKPRKIKVKAKSKK